MMQAQKVGEVELNNLALLLAQFALSELGDSFCCFSENDQYLKRLEQSEPPLIDEMHSQYFSLSKEGKGSTPIRTLLLKVRKLEPRTGYQYLIFLCANLQQTHRILFDLDKLSPPNKLKKLKKSGTRKDQLNHLQALLSSIPSYDTPKESPGEDYFKSYLSYVSGKKAAILLDCKLCAEADSNSFFWMLPQLCTYLNATKCAEFIHLVVSFVNPPQVCHHRFSHSSIAY